MNHWLFTCSPSVYPEVFDDLAKHRVTGWSISAHKKEVAIGDKIAMWVGGNVEPGIYMYAEISKLPHPGTTFRDSGPAIIDFVGFTNVFYFENNPIPLDALIKNRAFARTIKNIRRPHRTPVLLSPHDWNFLQSLRSVKSRSKKILSYEEVWDERQSKAVDREQRKIDRLYDKRPREKEVLAKSRVGQGVYRSRVFRVETQGCRVTKIKNPNFLVASHIKPWVDSNDTEKLDGNNGFLFAPHVDYLFDRGYISFTANGELLLSKSLEDSAIRAFKLPRVLNIGELNASQKSYLKYHKDFIFLK